MKSNVESEIMNTVKTTIQDHKMLAGIKDLIIAFSAGPDSVCLLDIVKNLYPDLTVHLVYINHGLRPVKYTQAEEDLTKKYAAKYKCKYSVVKIKVKKTKFGTEAAARAERYKVFLKVMKKTNSDRIALGHNLD